MFEGEALDVAHRTEGFSCGVDELDTWLTSWAWSSQRRGTARTFVWCSEGEMDVVAYFSLAPTVIARETLSPKLGRGEPTSIPGILLARLALDRSLHGQQLGGQLLLCALERAVTATQSVGGRYVVVDAISQTAVGFYEHFGLQRLPEAQGRTTRLVRKVSDIAASIAG